MNSTMQALILRRSGALADLQVQECEIPTLIPGYALVKIYSASLNPSDYKLALSGTANWKYPHIMGLDGAGCIIALDASDQNQLKIGDRVAFHGDYQMDGSFAEYCLVPLTALCPIPDSLSYDLAASLPCAGITAWQALHRRASLHPGSIVLIEGAAGGVGSLAVQLASQLGAKVIGTCSPENSDYVQSLGAFATIDYNLESRRERIETLSAGHGADLILDTISGHSATQALGMLACGASLVCTSGLPDISKLPHSTLAPMISELSLLAPFACNDPYRQKEMANDLGKVVSLCVQGAIQVHIHKTIPLADVSLALNELRERHVRGKIVVSIAT